MTCHSSPPIVHICRCSATMAFQLSGKNVSERVLVILDRTKPDVPSINTLQSTQRC